MTTIPDPKQVVEYTSIPSLTEGQYDLMIPYSRLSSKQNSKKFWLKINLSKGPQFVFYIMLGSGVTNEYFELTKSCPAYEQYAGLLFIGAVCGLLMSAIVLSVKGPRSIELGAKGIRFMGVLFPDSSNWIPWNAVESIDLVRHKGSKQTIELIVNRQALQAVLGAWHSWFFRTSGLVKGTKTGVKLVLDTDAIVHEPDQSKLLSVFKHFLPDAVHSSMYALGGLSHSKLWLKQFAETSPSFNLLDPLPKGTNLADGRFQIIERIGSGGHSLTYKASSNKPEMLSPDAEKIVALKEFVLPVRAGRDLRNRSLKHIENEIQILQKVDYPQIVKYVDSFISGNRAYISMEYVKGKSLRQIVNSKESLSETEIINIAVSMCSILEYLHGLSPPIIHCDFTPENLLLRDDGTLVLIDFNVAQQQESGSTKTVVGKHHYLPPEQFRGDTVTQSDIYACGGCIFWLCTGQDPDPLSVSHPKTIRNTISTELDTIVAKATGLALNERYTNVKELETDLKALINK